MEYDIHPDLDKILAKIAKKNLYLYEIIYTKMQQILVTNPSHYKNLRGKYSKYKRVHIGSIVLLFSVQNKRILFRDFDHHDVIYRKHL